MDPEQTFIRVQERFSQMLTPRVRATLEYMYLFIAITLFCILVVMHANYVQQPGCSSELSGVETTEAQLIQIKITSAGLWSQNESGSNAIDISNEEAVTDNLKLSNVDGDGLTFLAAKYWLNWIGSSARRGRLALKFWKADNELIEPQAESSTNSKRIKPEVEDAVTKSDKEEPWINFSISAKESIKAAIIHFGRKWYRRLSFFWRHATQILGSFQKLWNIAGINLYLDIPKWLHILHVDRLNSYAVQWLEKRSKTFEPTYLYTMEKGYFLLPDGAKSRHNIQTVNISISAGHSCFGNRWQQLLINRFVGYDTILMNSLLNSPGQGYLYNYQTKEFYNLSYAHEPPEGPARFGAAAFMQHLILYFWNRFEVPALQRFMQNRRSQLQQQPDFHITSSTILASTLHITRLNTRNPGLANMVDPTSMPGLRPVPTLTMPPTVGGTTAHGPREQLQNVNHPLHRPQQEAEAEAEAGEGEGEGEGGHNPGNMNSFSSLLLWILGGASSEGLNSFLSMFRDQGQIYPQPPPLENRQNQNDR